MSGCWSPRVPSPSITGDRITALGGARSRIPALYPYRSFVVAGGLASYGAEETVWFQQAAEYVDRILKGAKPGDLPIQHRTS